MAASDAVRVNTNQLPVGSQLSHPIYDETKMLLLAAGSPITARIKQRLLRRGITTVLLHPDDAAALQESETKSDSSSNQETERSADPVDKVATESVHSLADLKSKVEALVESASLLINNSGPPLRERAVSHGCSLYDAQQSQRLVKQFSVTKELLDEMVVQALAKGIRDVQSLSSTTSKYTAELAADVDNTVSSSIESAPDPGVTERGVRLAILGMSLAMELGWDEPNVREVGLCGLVHDWGMFRLPEKLQDPRNPILIADWPEVISHPLHTVDLLEPVANISNAVRLAASQVHENADGSGYPRGLTKAEIHPYAKILHVADAYITLTADMRGRPPYLPYDAMVYLLNQVKSQRMDEEVMRALLNVVSLFPIGSRVRLSDGTEAQVIRRSASEYTAPIVQRVGANRQLRADAAHASIVDLAQSDIRVMAPLPTPQRQEARMDDSLMDKIVWDGADE